MPTDPKQRATLIQAKWDGNPARCSNTKCKTIIGPGERYFIDTAAEASYCEPCGASLRYHRKKAGERGDTMPLTFEDAETLLEAGR